MGIIVGLTWVVKPRNVMGGRAVRYLLLTWIGVNGGELLGVTGKKMYRYKR